VLDGTGPGTCRALLHGHRRADLPRNDRADRPPGRNTMSDYRQRIADKLEEAWQNGEISHRDACEELAELDGER